MSPWTDKNELRRRVRERQFTILLLLLAISGFIVSFLTLKNIIALADDSLVIYNGYRFLNPSKALPDWTASKGLNVLPYLPFFLVFGSNRLALRLSQSFFISLTLIPLCLLVKKLYHDQAAIITGLLLISFPFFIFTSIGETAFFAFFSLTSLLLFYLYYSTNRSVYLYLGSLVLGIGIASKIIFVLFLLALILTLFATKRDLGWYRKHIGYREGLIALISFLVGLSPLIILEVAKDFSLTHFLLENVLGTSRGHDNLQLAQNLLARLRGLVESFFRITNDYSLLNPLNRFRGVTTLVFFVSGCGYMIFASLRQRRSRFLLLLSLIFILLSTFTPSSMHVTHLLVILPLMFSFTAVALSRLERRLMAPLLLLILVPGFMVTLETSRSFNSPSKTLNRFPGVAKVHAKVPERVENYSIIASPLPYQNLQLLNHYRGQKQIHFLESEQRVTGWQPEKNKIRGLIRGLIADRKAVFIFPAIITEPEILPLLTQKQRELYNAWCTSPKTSENPCLFAYKSLHNLSQGRKVERVDVIRDYKHRPVYYLYQVRGDHD